MAKNFEPHEYFIFNLFNPWKFVPTKIKPSKVDKIITLVYFKQMI